MGEPVPIGKGSRRNRTARPAGSRTPRNESSATERIEVDRDGLIGSLDSLLALDDLVLLKNRALAVRDSLASTPAIDSDPAVPDPARLRLKRTPLLEEVDQAIDAQTLERARYYLRRLRRGLCEVRTGRLNDLNLLRWKEYDEIETDSLWIVERRDASGSHSAEYWGNFVPQIPRQLMLRFTKRGEWVLDGFCGSGTTLIECRRLGRNGLGIELNPSAAARARAAIEREPNPAGVVTPVAEGDLRAAPLSERLREAGTRSVQLALMHPPYHNIVRFSDSPEDLSNAADTAEFLAMLGQTVENVTQVLDRGRHLALVIGDKFAHGEWIPLGFYCMQAVLERGYSLKSIVVKNFEGTRGKRTQSELWRYRALAGGFYVFKHEYVILFTKE